MKIPIAWFIVSMKDESWKESTQNLEKAILAVPALKGKYNFVYLDDDK